MKDIYFVDGKFVPADEATLPIHDLQILRGYGVFDFTRTYKRKPFRLEAHIDRLFYSAERIGLDIQRTREEIIAITHETVAQNPHHQESFVRILVTGGATEDAYVSSGHTRIIVLVTPVKNYPESVYTDGAKVLTVNEPRYLPGVKSLSYISAVRGKKQAHAQGAIEAIYSDDKYVFEGTTTNFFAFCGNTLVTPGRDILLGITRQVVLELVQDVYPLAIRDLTRDEFYGAEEAFLTSSVSEVIPIVQVDAATIGAGKPGERTRHIMKLFAEYVAGL